MIKKALVFVKNLGVEVPNEEIEMIQKAKLPIATSLGTDRVKINSEFDNSMGAKDSCELCELIGLFLLKEVTERLERLKVDFSIALYRDDLILIIRKHGKTINRIKSEISKVFTKHELELCDWEEGVEQDYLDIKFNIDKNEYEPYKKKNDNTKYLSVDSDHPDIILKSIPKIVENRINMLSSSKEIFDKKKIEYENALKKQGYENVSFKYKNVESLDERKLKAEKKLKNKSKAREVIWFLPPYSKQVESTTSVGKSFSKY